MRWVVSQPDGDDKYLAGCWNSQTAHQTFFSTPPPPKTLIKSMKDRVNPGLVTLQLTFIDKGRRLTARGQAGNVKKKKTGQMKVVHTPHRMKIKREVGLIQLPL